MRPPLCSALPTTNSRRTWLLRWERPNCWMALSADQGSSRVMWQRRRLFFTLRADR